MHPAFDYLKPKLNLVLDNVGPESDFDTGDDMGFDVDSDSEPSAASVYTNQDIALKAAAAVVDWSETQLEDLDVGETLLDRLIVLLTGIADANMDGEISEDEADMYDSAANAAWLYLSSKGASDEDLEAMFNREDDDAADRVQELLGNMLPDNYDDINDDINDFAFAEGDGSDEATFDSVFKKIKAFRNGAKTFIKKRISGVVHRSAAQKAAVRKMQAKSHGAAAQAKRKKTMRKRTQAGM